MWLINVVIIITFLLFLTYVTLKAIKNKDIVLYILEVLAIVFECIFVAKLFKGTSLSSIVQVLVLVFSYIIPMGIFVLDNLNVSFKLNILYVVAKLAYAIKKYEFSEGILKGAIRKDKNTVKFYYLRSKALEKLGNIPEARDMMFKVISLDNENKTAYLDLAYLLDKENKKDTAIVMLAQALRIDENYVEAKEMLGIIYLEIGRFIEAESIYKELLELENVSYSTYYNLANIYLRKQDYVEAKEYYLRTIEKNAKCMEAYLGLANMYYMLEDYDSAIDALDRILDDNTLKSQAMYMKLMVYMKLQDIENATSVLEELIKLDNTYLEKIKSNKLFEDLMPLVNNIEDELPKENVVITSDDIE